jgi:hypothetical protein
VGGAGITIKREGEKFSSDITDGKGELLVYPAEGDNARYSFTYDEGGVCEQTKSFSYEPCAVKCLNEYSIDTELLCPDNVINIILSENGNPVSGADISISRNGEHISTESTNAKGAISVSAENHSASYLFVYDEGGVCEKKKSFSYEQCQPSKPCETDLDCADSEYCMVGYVLPGECYPVDCECGVIEEHACNPYECCKHSDCSFGEKCMFRKCIPPVECKSDLDCASDQVCGSESMCEPVPEKECGYAADHLWHDYACCDDPACPKDKICVNHNCMAYSLNASPEGYVGELQAAEVLPYGKYAVQIKDPSGNNRTIGTDDSGKFVFSLDSEGVYTLYLLRNQKAISSIDVNALDISLKSRMKKIMANETGTGIGQLIILDDAGNMNPLLLPVAVLFALAIIAYYIYFVRRR